MKYLKNKLQIQIAFMTCIVLFASFQLKAQDQDGWENLFNGKYFLNFEKINGDLVSFMVFLYFFKGINMKLMFTTFT